MYDRHASHKDSGQIFTTLIVQGKVHVLLEGYFRFEAPEANERLSCAACGWRRPLVRIFETSTLPMRALVHTTHERRQNGCYS